MGTVRDDWARSARALAHMFCGVGLAFAAAQARADIWECSPAYNKGSEALDRLGGNMDRLCAASTFDRIDSWASDVRRACGAEGRQLEASISLIRDDLRRRCAERNSSTSASGTGSRVESGATGRARYSPAQIRQLEAAEAAEAAQIRLGQHAGYLAALLAECDQNSWSAEGREQCYMNKKREFQARFGSQQPLPGAAGAGAAPRQVFKPTALSDGSGKPVEVGSYEGKECCFFNKACYEGPIYENSTSKAGAGNAYRVNKYSENTHVCHGGQRYQCISGAWHTQGQCPSDDYWRQRDSRILEGVTK